MSVRIDQITVQNLGPIKDFQFKLGSFNLIYGKNETGKTYLVEFILRSLFKSIKKWNLRETAANGKILVSGLNKELVEFSPTSRKKIEDFWLSVREGIPVNMEKLLVVRGAELNLKDNTPGGVDRTIIREFLSSKAILDDIQSRISKTLQKSSIAKHLIVGSRAGEIKGWHQIQEGLDTIDDLFQEIDNLYSAGYRAELEKQLTAVQKRIETQKQAKRNLAYTINEEISRLEREKGELSKDVLKKLRDANKDFKGAQERIQSKEGDIEDFRKDSEDYTWLKNAVEEYKDRVSELELHERKTFLVLAIAFLVATMVLQGAVWADLIERFVGSILAIASLGLAAVMGYLHTRSQSQLLRDSFNYFEEQQIASEFEDRFGEKLTNLAAMETLEDRLRERHHRRETYKEIVEDERENLLSNRITILDMLSQFEGILDQEGPWDDDIQVLEERLEEIERVKRQSENQLAGLNVEPIEYLEKYPGEKFAKEVLHELNLQKENLEKNIMEEDSKLDTLRQKICQETKDLVSTPWDLLIEHLRLRRAEKVAEYKRLTAEILAKILIHDELQILHEQEDENIQDTMRSKIMSKPLRQITNRYEKIGVDGDRLFVSDPYSTFPVSELSTGAKEQVLLALRIGCASRIMGKDCLFLILDDAFQHADWDRRGGMLEESVRLAKAGWQIVYLTMDDHLRDLFLSTGKKVFKKEFTYKELNNYA
ncbi:MAG: AAA family ATPase [Anaerolineales bacterium]|nr:AAA family ATPase [Anaerolineales bacterium]